MKKLLVFLFIAILFGFVPATLVYVDSLNLQPVEVNELPSKENIYSHD